MRTTRWKRRCERAPSSWRVDRPQSLWRACASADFLFAAWFLWITPLLAALSSLRLVEASSSAALSFSPASAASRNARTAVRSDDFTDLLRSRALSLVRVRFCCDLMLATRNSLANLNSLCCHGLPQRLNASAATAQGISPSCIPPKWRPGACGDERCDAAWHSGPSNRSRRDQAAAAQVTAAAALRGHLRRL